MPQRPIILFLLAFATSLGAYAQERDTRATGRSQKKCLHLSARPATRAILAPAEARKINRKQNRKDAKNVKLDIERAPEGSGTRQIRNLRKKCP